jgi:dihydrofolate reductase
MAFCAEDQALKAGRLDRLVITQIPVALGEGIPLFQNIDLTWFTAESTILHNGVYPQTRYTPRGEAE